MARRPECGAIRRSLGAGIEFLSLGEIREQFGFLGVSDYVPAYGRLGAITGLLPPFPEPGQHHRLTVGAANCIGLLRWLRPSAQLLPLVERIDQRDAAPGFERGTVARGGRDRLRLGF